jgi:hypothetical protein
MSHAFVREGDDMSLSDISPTIQALIHFLTQENGGIRVYEKERIELPEGNAIHKMSNGLSYGKDKAGKWEVLL